MTQQAQLYNITSADRCNEHLQWLEMLLKRNKQLL